MILTPHQDEQYAFLAVKAYLAQLVGGTSDLKLKTATEGEYALARGTFVYAQEGTYSFEARVLRGDIWPRVGRLVVYLQTAAFGGLVSLEQTGEFVFQVTGDQSEPEIKSPWITKELSTRLREKDGI